MDEKKESEIPPWKKKFVFNVDFRGVNNDISIVAATEAQARRIINDLYPGTTISFVRVEE